MAERDVAGDAGQQHPALGQRDPHQQAEADAQEIVARDMRRRVLANPARFSRSDTNAAIA
ncbi:hypothetical protein D3C83_67600 [compost metagenome]